MVAESEIGNLVPRWQKAGMRVLVPWWHKVYLGALCHGGRKYGWEPCATVAESIDGSLMLRWQKEWMGALCHGGTKYVREPCAMAAESEIGSLLDDESGYIKVSVDRGRAKNLRMKGGYCREIGSMVY